MKKIYLVAGPIGNLDDLSLRSISLLKEVNIIIAENPLHTSKILQKLNIENKKLIRLAEFNSSDEIYSILNKINEDCIYISDAGTPNISDPGGQIVEVARGHDWEIVPIPGPSAVTAMISACGFPAIPFVFYGFPPVKKGRAKFFEKIAKTEYLTIIFESKHRIEKTLEQLPQDRYYCLGREISKIHEEFIWGDLDEIKKQLKSIKGEFTIAIAPLNYGK